MCDPTGVVAGPATVLYEVPMKTPTPLTVPGRLPALPSLPSPSRRSVLAGGTALLVGCRPDPIAGPPTVQDSGTRADSGATDSGLDETDGWDTGGTDTGGTDTGDGGGTEPDALDFSAYTEDVDTFPTACITGVIEQTSVVAGTTATREGPFVLVVVDEALVVVSEQEVRPSATGAIRVPLEGLEPGRRYAWALLDDDRRSAVAQFLTAPEDGSLEPLTVGISACNGSSNDPWPSLQALASEQVDLFLHLGDMAYNDAANTEAEYRESWRWYLSGDGFRQVYASAGMLATWDDHEVTNDWDPDSVEAGRVQLAKDSFFEHIPVWQGSDGRIWRSYRWGLTAEIFVLDCRSERVPDSREDDDAEYISAAQLEWLTAALADSPCHFKIVMNSVPITNMPWIWDLAASDRWEGYAAQREALLNHLSDSAIGNVWFVAGDFHVNFTGLVQPGGDGVLAQTYEIACTGGNSNPLGWSLEPFYPAQFQFSNAEARAVTLRFDPDLDVVIIRFLNDDGSIDEEVILSQA